MTLTPSYNPNGLSPKILIHDIDGTLKYTFESEQIAASPTQDFTLTDGALHLGVNDDFGSFTFLIDDHDGNIIDATDHATSSIKQQWSVQLYLGKSSSTLNRWFYGKVIDAKVLRPQTGIMQIIVTAVGWGIKTKYRYTNIKRFQKKDSDGITLDSTDTTVKLSEIAKDIVQDTDHFITDGLTAESEITVTGVDDIDIKLPDFQQTSQTFASALSTLAAWANAYWGIDADRDLYLHVAGSKSSGFLFTNDLTGLDAQGWDEDKIGYLQNSNFDWSNSSHEGAFSLLHAFGGNSITLETNVVPTANALYTMESTSVAWKITPQKDNIERIALSINKTGTPANGSAEFFIVGDDGSGGPNMDDIRGSGKIGEDKLTGLPTSGTNWVEIGFNVKGGIPVNPREELFIVVKKYGTASHNIALENDTTTDTDYWHTTDLGGNSWTQVTGASGVTFLHRVYSNRTVVVTLEDVNARRKYGQREIGFSMRQDVQVETITEALVHASDLLSKEKRSYRNIMVTPVTDRLPLGQTVRVQDSQSGLNVEVDVIGIDAYFSSSDPSNVGIESLTLSLQEING